ncbi:universal stress protein, partial [Streptomyces sp. WAC04770]
MTTHDLPVIAAVDGSTHSWQALDWATHEAVRRRLPLLIVHVRPLTRTADEETRLREADELLAEAVRRSEALAPALSPSTLAPLDFPAAALVSLGRDASMVVVGSRGLGGFRSLLIGSNSLATASMASCPVVVVQDAAPDEDDRPEEAGTSSDIVAGVAADESSEAVLE